LIVPISISVELNELTPVLNLVNFKGGLVVLLPLIICKVSKGQGCRNVGATLHDLIEKRGHLGSKLSVVEIVQELIIFPVIAMEMATNYIEGILVDHSCRGCDGGREQREKRDVFIVREGGTMTAAWRVHVRWMLNRERRSFLGALKGSSSSTSICGRGTSR
jgi:hypothetical protein